MPLSRRLRLPAVAVAATLAGALVPGAVLPAAAATRPWGPSTALAPLTPGSPAAPAAAAGTGDLTAALVLTQTGRQRALLGQLARRALRSRPGLLRAALPAPTQRDAVAGWARSHGFRVLSSGAFVVEVAGDARALADALGTHVAPTRWAGGTYLAKTAPAAVPTELRGAVSAVVGLDARPLFHPHAVTSHVRIGPTEVRAIGNEVNASPSAGSGVTVGTLQLHPWTASDVTTWAAHPRGPGSSPELSGDPVTNGQITQISADGSPIVDPKVDRGGEEVSLDVEALLASAPAAKQRVYFADNRNSAGYLAILDRMTQDGLAGNLQVASSSWGACEGNATSQDLRSLHDALGRLTDAGVTFFAASGDSGAYDCAGQDPTQTGLAVDYPASDPRTVAVGGVHATSTTGAAGSWTYTAWGPARARDVAPASVSGGGGGYSAVYTTKDAAYQQNPSAPGRVVPDIAGLADPTTGMVAYVTHQVGENQFAPEYVLGGGTSLAAPLSAGALAGVLSAAGAPKTGFGDIHAALYANPADFQPVTSGTNGFYSSGTCFNPATGLGVPDWTRLAAVLGKPVALTTTSGCTSSASVGIAYPASAAATGDWFAAFDAGTGSAPASSSAPACGGPAGSATVPTTVALQPGAGFHHLGLEVRDHTSQACSTVETSLFVESSAPHARPLAVGYLDGTEPRFALSYGFDFPQPSSGLRYYDVTIHDDTARRDVVTDDRSPLDGGVLGADPGHHYTATVAAVTNAGLSSDVARASFQAPYDDTQMSRRGFRSVRAGQAYHGSYSVASARGARIGLRFSGSRAQVGFTTGPRMGLVDVLLDGRRVRTLDTWSRRTAYRQRLLTVVARRSGTHTLVLVVTGRHGKRSRGNAVGVDSVAVG